MKQINDELGHEIGDHALRAAGEVLNAVFRPSDVIARLLMQAAGASTYEAKRIRHEWPSIRVRSSS